MSEEFQERRQTPPQLASWHAENVRKIDALDAKLDAVLSKQAENQALTRESFGAIMVKLDDLYGQGGNPGRVEKLEDRVDKLEEQHADLHTKELMVRNFWKMLAALASIFGLGSLLERHLTGK